MLGGSQVEGWEIRAPCEGIALTVFRLVSWRAADVICLGSSSPAVSF